MFGLFKKNNSTSYSNHLPIEIDFHSHILPGLDDGSPNIETSLILVKGMRDLGIKKIIATPHVFSDIYKNEPYFILAALDLLKGACEEEGINIELSAAAEYMLDNYFIDLLRQREKLLTIQGKFLLTELTYSAWDHNVYNIYQEITENEYRPILAHPERYLYLQQNTNVYHKLKEMGVLFQLNILSITGYYGRATAKTANMLLNNGLIDFVSTDLHNEYQLTALNKNLEKINSILIQKNISNSLLDSKI